MAEIECLKFRETVKNHIKSGKVQIKTTRELLIPNLSLGVGKDSTSTGHGRPGATALVNLWNIQVGHPNMYQNAVVSWSE